MTGNGPVRTGRARAADDPVRAPARIPVARLVEPRSVAVIGASDDLGKFGGRVVHYLAKFGFPGAVLPINPRGGTVQGLPAYPSVADLPDGADVAVLAVPAERLEAQVRACADAGIGACIVITGKLGEAGPEGAAIEARLAGIARATGMRLLGPNCLGIVNATGRAALSSTLALEGPVLRPGGIGLISQSGALMGTLLSLGLDYGAGFSRCISVGNQADLELCDFLDHLIEDAATRVIALYVEGLRDPPRFRALLARARAAGKPVLVVKAGRSEAGARAARSHTASLAGSYAAFEAVCRAGGAATMEDPATMILAADALDRLPRLAAPGLGVAVMASSGGAVVTAADQLPGIGARLARMGDATRAALAALMPDDHVHLPLDTGSFHGGTSEAGIRAALAAFMADPDVGAILYPMTTMPRMADHAARLPAISREGGKPILYAMTAGRVGDAARAAMLERAFPWFDRVGDALAALRAMEAVAARPAARPERPPGAGPAVPARLRPGPLTEAETKRLVAAYGIPVTRQALARTPEEAAAAADAIGYPAVLKGVSRAVAHKSDLGLVRLGLGDAAAVRAAAAEILRTLERVAPGAAEGVLVQETGRGEVELILGVVHDPGFGPMVLAGAGGTLVEVTRDTGLAPAPIGPEEAEALLRRLAVWPVLQGVRGRPPADVAAAAEALSRLSWLAHDLGDRLAELDINPLVVRARGGGVLALDGRATLRDGAEEPP